MQSALQALNALKHPILSTSINYERESISETTVTRSSLNEKAESVPQKNFRSKGKKKVATDHLTSWTLQQISPNLVDDKEDFIPTLSNTQQIGKTIITTKKGGQQTSQINRTKTSFPEKSRIEVKSAIITYIDETNETNCADKDSEFTSFISELQQYSSQIKKTLNAIDEIDLKIPQDSDLFTNKFSNFIAPSGLYTPVASTELQLPDVPKSEIAFEVVNTSLILAFSDAHSNPSLTMSNYGRFINDQCTRTETAIAAEFHIRMLDMNSKSLIEELGDVNNSIEIRKEKGIDIKFDMAMGGQTEDRGTEITTTRSDEEDAIGNTPALRAQMHWLDDVQQLIIKVQEFVNEAFEANLQIESVTDKCNRFKSVCLGKTRKLIFSERAKLERRVDALDQRAQQQEIEILSLRAAIEAKRQSIQSLQDESLAERELIDSRYKAIIDRYEESIALDNEKISSRKEKLAEMLSTDSKWKEILQELKEKRRTTAPAVRLAAVELAKDLLDEIKVEKGKEKLMGLQKELQQTTFEVKELSEALKVCTVEESTLKEKVKVAFAQIEEETKSVREKLKDVSKVSQDILSAVGELEEATFERKRKEKNKLKDKYRANAFRLGNKVPTSAGSMGFGISESDVAHDRAAHSKEQQSQLMEDSATLFLIPRLTSPSPLDSESERTGTANLNSPKKLNITPVVVNENMSMTNVNLAEFPNPVDENADTLFDKRTEELLNITKNEQKRESLLKAGHSLIKNSMDRRKPEMGANSPRKLNSKSISNSKPIAAENESIRKRNEDAVTDKDGATTNMNSLVCTAFYWNYLHMEQEHDVDVINKKFPVYHLAEPTADQYGEFQKISYWRFNNFLGHAKTILKNIFASKKGATNSGSIYSMRDALTVVRGVLVTLTRCYCIEQSDSTDIDKDIAFISTGLLFTKANSVEAEDLRYRLHICCNKILLLAFSKGAKIIILRNSKKIFADILSCCFALVGVVINCSLRNNVPWGRSKFVFRSTSSVETTAANIIHIVVFQMGAKMGTKSLSKSVSTSSHAPLDSFGMILNIFHELEFLFLNTFDERTDSENAAIKNLLQSVKSMIAAGSASIAAHTSNSNEVHANYGYTIYHRNAIYAIQLGLFALFNCKSLDGDNLSARFEQIVSNADKDVYGLKDTSSMDQEVHVIPTDIDELLLAVCPQIIPAILACELLRLVIEKHLKKTKFLEDLKSGASNAADLQYLNIGQPPELDVSITQFHQQQQQQQEQLKDDDGEARRLNAAPPSMSDSVTLSRTKPGAGNSSSTSTLATADTSETQIALIQMYSSEIGASDLNKGLHVDKDVSTIPRVKEAIEIKTDHFYESPAIVVSSSGSAFTLPQSPPMNTQSSKKTTSTLRKQHFKDSNTAISSTSTAKSSPKKASAMTLHMRWLMDMELYMQSVCRHIFSLIKPYALNPPAILDRIISSVSSLSLGGMKSNLKLGVQHTLDFPLSSSLAYQIVNHIENVRLLALAHHPDGEQRVQRTADEFFDIIDQLRKAREKMLNVVTALAWPMKKKLDWLKIKYKVACEEFMRNTTELQGIQSLITSLVAEREEFHRSFLIVEKDKNHNIVNNHSRGLPKNTLALAAHPSDIQKKIMDHVTNGNRVKLANLIFTENELHKVSATLEGQYDRAEKLNDKLEIAYTELIASGKVVAEADNLPINAPPMSYTTLNVHDMKYSSVLESVKNGSTTSDLKLVNPPAPNYSEFLDSALSEREAHSGKVHAEVTSDFDGVKVRSRLPTVATMEGFDQDQRDHGEQLKVPSRDRKREISAGRSAEKQVHHPSRRMYSPSKSNREQFFDLSRRSSPLDVGSPPQEDYQYRHELDLSFTNELNRIHSSSKATEKEHNLFDQDPVTPAGLVPTFSAGIPDVGRELDLSFSDELNRIHCSNIADTQLVRQASRELSPFVIDSDLLVGNLGQHEYTHPLAVSKLPPEESIESRFLRPSNDTAPLDVIQSKEHQDPTTPFVNPVSEHHPSEVAAKAEKTTFPSDGIANQSEEQIRFSDQPDSNVSVKPIATQRADRPTDTTRIVHTQPNIAMELHEQNQTPDKVKDLQSESYQSPSAIRMASIESKLSISASNPANLALPSPTAKRTNLVRIPYRLNNGSNDSNKKYTSKKTAEISDELPGEEESADNSSTMSLSSYVDLSNYKMLSHPSHRLGETPKIFSEMHYTNTKGSKPANNLSPSQEKLLPTIVEKKPILSKATAGKNKVMLPQTLKGRLDKASQHTSLQAPSLIIKTMSFAPCISDGLQPTLLKRFDSPSKEDSFGGSQDSLKTLGGTTFNAVSTGVHEIIMDKSDGEDEKRINIALLDSNNHHTLATAITESVIRHATKRVVSTTFEARELKQELEFQIAELQHFDRLVEKEMKKTMKKAAAIHPAGAAYYKEWSTNRNERWKDDDVDLTLRGRGAHYKALIEAQRNRMAVLQKKSRSYFIIGDKWGSDFKQSGALSDDDEKKSSSPFKETQLQVERISRMPFVVTARDLLKEQEILDHLHHPTGGKSVSFVDSEHSKEKGGSVYADDEERSLTSLASLSEEGSSASVFREEEDDGTPADFALTKTWMHQSLSTPPGHTKPSSRFLSSGRKITETARE